MSCIQRAYTSFCCSLPVGLVFVVLPFTKGSSSVFFFWCTFQYFLQEKELFDGLKEGRFFCTVIDWFVTAIFGVRFVVFCLILFLVFFLFDLLYRYWKRSF